MVDLSARPDPDRTRLRERLAGAVRGRVSFDNAARALYTADASNYRHLPAGVVIPETVDDVIAAVEVCRSLGAPIVPRGGGTSIAGNDIGPGVIIDSSRYLTEITEIDPERRIARVQPGVVLDDLRAAAAPHGLTFGPDPSTHNRCTLGGMIGNNACGSHSVAWGTTADNVESLDVLLADGTRLTVGATSRDRLAALAAEPTRQGRLYAELQALTEKYLGPIRTGMPRLPRRVSGYALDWLLPENGVQVARALTGTEGSCVTVLGATVRLVPAPAARVLVVLGYPSAPAAADAVPELLDHHPLTVEGLDRELVESFLRRRPAAPVPLPDGQAWLLVEVAGEDPAAAAAAGQRLLAALSGAARPAGSRLVTEAAGQRVLWRIREEGAGIATRSPDGSEAWPGWEDAAVPPERLGDYLRDFERLMARYGRRGVAYGHFGEGCMHIRIDFALGDRQRGVPEFRAFMEDAADLVARHGGSLSGEHGDGQARAELLPRMYGAELCQGFAEFKGIWDPDNLMNPGTIVSPRKLDADLRVATPVRQPVTVFSYPEDNGDFAVAARRCLGVGKCRRSGGGTMCPSYMVTKEEQHSTRGRARMLFEMLAGDLITDGWRSTEVRDALDLCLSCKACRSECPVNVDMATYKAEFLHHHYRHRLRPASHYSMGWLPLWARFASAAPALTNRIMRNPLLSGPLKRIGGIAAQRAVPEFAADSFTSWFRSRPGGADSARPPVLLWPDTFTNFLEPRIGIAAVRVLERQGFRVVLPERPVCCGLTWVSTGQLSVARAVMRRSLRVLGPHLAAGTPIVGLEPSCTAALRTDLPELLAGQDSDRAARSVFTLAEFLRREAPQGTARAAGSPADGGSAEAAGNGAGSGTGTRAITQVHCHQNAVLGFGPDAEILAAAGIRNQVLDSGCCGLAGNFGFEREHYEVSRAAGERVLLPAVRAAEADTVVLADGFSCRTQIAQGTGRRALHLAELLAAALDEPAEDHRPDGSGHRPNGGRSD